MFLGKELLTWKPSAHFADNWHKLSGCAGDTLGNWTLQMFHFGMGVSVGGVWEQVILVTR